MKHVLHSLVFFTATWSLSSLATTNLALKPLSKQQYEVMVALENVTQKPLTAQQVDDLKVIVDGESQRTSLLACVGVSAGLVFKGEGAICYKSKTKEYYSLIGWGVGMSLGWAGRGFGVLAQHDSSQSICTTYSGGILSSSPKGAQVLTKQIVKGIIKSFGPDFGYFSAPQGQSIFLVGLQFGPMVDLSYTEITIHRL
jgi:hypothetical protein